MQDPVNTHAPLAVDAPARPDAGFILDGKPNWKAIGFDVHCHQCSYNLRTLTEPRCTECGWQFQWKLVLDEAARRAGPSAFLRNGEPVWGAIEYDVSCSRCAYNLRTLTRPRCPECGLDFRWEVVLDRSAWRSDFLFEHNFQVRPARSWLKTVWRSFRPGEFWSKVSIHDSIQAGPLCLMLFLSIVSFFVLIHAAGGGIGVGLLAIDGIVSPGNPAWPAWPVGSGGWVIGGRWVQYATSMEAAGDGLQRLASAPLNDFQGWSLFVTALAQTLGTVLVFLCSLRQTLGRRRLRAVQVLRVVAYMATPALAISALCFLAFVATVKMVTLSSYFSGPHLLAFAVFVPSLFALYLGSGLKHYLGIHGPWRVGFVAVYVSLLFTATVFGFLNVTLRGGWS